MWAVMKVLDGKRKPMTAVEIHAEIAAGKLATGLKGKTPEQTVAAALAVHAKRGLYVERAAPGKFRLRKAIGTKPVAPGPVTREKQATDR
jgi:HB1/ASXL restriction endonuclease-like protein with HTH domain